MLDFLRSVLYKTIGKQIYPCRIEEINTQKKHVIIHCRGITAPVKLQFDEVVNDIVVISNLSPRHASWLGYYYGKFYNDFLNRKNYYSENSGNEFIFKESKKRYRIVSQSRGGSISYLDSISDKIITCSALDILTSDDLIMKFDSLEACYIGILGGIFISRNMGKKSIKPPVKNLMRLVK
jgi:hypothetical protein